MRPLPLARTYAVAAAICVLTACGGGGSDSAPAAAPSVTPDPSAASPGASASAGLPSRPLTSFLSNGEGTIATYNIDIDDTGSFSSTSGGTRYQLQENSSGCSMTSNPTDADVAVCNVLAAGKAFLFCENTLTPHYTAGLFRRSDVEVATHWELAGKTLTGIACGSSGPRTTSYSFVFSADGETAIEYTGPSTWNYGAGSLEMMERTTSCTLTNVGFCQRLLIYKVRNGGATHYFLLVLWQMPATATPRPVNVYYLQT